MYLSIYQADTIPSEFNDTEATWKSSILTPQRKLRGVAVCNGMRKAARALLPLPRRIGVDGQLSYLAVAVSLVEPIFNAQLDSVRRSRVIAMDETPIKAGRAGPGKMKAAYFWPVVGEQDEICFLYYPSRAAKHVEAALGLQRPHGAVLQSDGYSAYEHYEKKTGITHAQCWAHARRKIFDARDIEPAQADQVLDAIAAPYKVEQQIRDDGLTGQA